MKRFALLTLALASSAAFAAAPKADIAKGKEIATSVCASCHAADGNSGISMYPKLSAQHAGYIFQQTKEIKEGKRTTGASAAMMPMVLGLSDQDIADVSAYFSQQFPKQGETNPKQNPELGAQIFRGGLKATNLPACMSCHGPNGAGIHAGSTVKDGNIAYPRLGGQHQAYIVEQLKAYQSGQRANPVMVDIAKRMTEEEMNAVGNFIQGLH